MEVGVWIADEELNFELYQVFPARLVQLNREDSLI